MRIGIATDIHLGRGGARGIEQYQKSFSEMIDGMIYHKCDLALFGGDIFNLWSLFNPRTFDIFAEGMMRLKAADILTKILPGNHDFDISGIESAVEPFTKLGIEVINQPKTDIYRVGGVDGDTVLVTFIPWITRGLAQKAGVDMKESAEIINQCIFNQFVYPEFKKAEDAIKSNRYSAKILLFHASVIGFDMGSAKCTAGLDFTLYPENINSWGYDFIIGGHFHKRQEDKGVIYVGSMERQNFGERDNPTGWLLLDGKKKQFIELKTTQQFAEVDYDLSTRSLDEFIKTIPGLMLRDKAVKFRYKIRRGDGFDRARLMKALYDAGAKSVILDPDYIEEVQARSQNINAEQDFFTQFLVWKDVNPDKDSDGALHALLKKEFESEFIENADTEFLKEMAAA